MTSEQCPVAETCYWQLEMPLRIKGERKSKHMVVLRRSLIFLPTGRERPTDFQTQDDVLVDAEPKKRERPKREHRSLEANHSFGCMSGDKEDEKPLERDI